MRSLEGSTFSTQSAVLCRSWFQRMPVKSDAIAGQVERKRVVKWRATSHRGTFTRVADLKAAIRPFIEAHIASNV
ncbi:hypothetical protein J2Y83_001896 [Pseudomonas marginalis]|uniref:hypothetical protein n=1 Tax=Pseudomonas TaxID=286 RepID=UPI0020A19A51|nr:MULTISPECIES: hypothetical protein [Pseudomonas]MCP1505923.1 hypothetical protein [Pseudomonas marginalis]MCP1523427.1 hypothetical protein [Pseudomonas marginalis]MDQ0501792.1 hypothetical protein [Pseudomonas marginalis]